jgi:TPP-dependent pyruvate/acetoin dehydrogenase alpha subunit
LTKGGDLKRMWAELYGKITGCARGKAGSMHLVDTGCGMMGTSAIVGTTIPQSVGYAWAIKQRQQKRVVVSFFGEGAADEGAFHESMNFAALGKLPVIFVCENNSYAIYSHIKNRMPEVNFCERAESYRVPARHIDEGDVFAIYNAVSETAEAIRTSGVGPFFYEISTCRWRDHVGPEENVYIDARYQAEIRAQMQRNEVARVEAMIEASERAKIKEQVEAAIEEAIAFAEESPFPDDSELFQYVYRE